MGVRARDVVGAAAGFAAGVAVGVGVAWAGPTNGDRRAALTGYDVDLTGPIRVTKTWPPTAETTLQPYFVARGLDDRVRIGDGTTDPAARYTVTLAGTRGPVAVLCRRVQP